MQATKRRKTVLSDNLFNFVNPVTGKYHCPECQKGFKGRSGLKQHYQDHTGQYSYWCGECKKGFTCKGNYEKHVSKHEGRTWEVTPVTDARSSTVQKAVCKPTIVATLDKRLCTEKISFSSAYWFRAVCHQTLAVCGTAGACVSLILTREKNKFWPHPHPKKMNIRVVRDVEVFAPSLFSDSPFITFFSDIAQCFSPSCWMLMFRAGSLFCVELMPLLTRSVGYKRHTRDH